LISNKFIVQREKTGKGKLGKLIKYPSFLSHQFPVIPLRAEGMGLRAKGNTVLSTT
jgi:hypothetical protein